MGLKATHSKKTWNTLLFPHAEGYLVEFFFLWVVSDFDFEPQKHQLDNSKKSLKKVIKKDPCFFEHQPISRKPTLSSIKNHANHSHRVLVPVFHGL